MGRSAGAGAEHDGKDGEDNSALSASALRSLQEARAVARDKRLSVDVSAARAEGARVAQLLLHPSVSNLLSKRKLGEFSAAARQACHMPCILPPAQILRAVSMRCNCRDVGAAATTTATTTISRAHRAPRRWMAHCGSSDASDCPGGAADRPRRREFCSGVCGEPTVCTHRRRGFGARACVLPDHAQYRSAQPVDSRGPQDDRRQYLDVPRIDNGSDFPAAALRALYRSIAAEEMRLDAW